MHVRICALRWLDRRFCFPRDGKLRDRRRRDIRVARAKHNAAAGIFDRVRFPFNQIFNNATADLILFDGRPIGDRETFRDGRPSTTRVCSRTFDIPTGLTGIIRVT